MPAALQTRCSGLKKNDRALEALVYGTSEALREEGIEAYTIATIAHKAARIVRGKLMTRLFVALAITAGDHIRDFNSQDLANTAWAFTTVGHKDKELFAAFTAATEQRITDFNSQALANTAFAFAKVAHKD